MKRNTFILTAAIVGLSALVATATLAGQGHGQGFMQGNMQGQGMMQGQGHGGQDHGQGFMQGNMQGQGKGDCSQGAQTLDTPLTIEDVRTNLTSKLDMRGNDRLKVGNITETDANTITAEIVTVDDSLVRKIEIDKKTGQHSPVN